MPRYDDTNYQQLLDRGHHTEDGRPEALPRRTRYGSREASAYGLRPMADYLTDLVPEDSIEQVIAECHAKKLFPMYHLEASGLLEPWNQDGFGLCWAYGLTAAVTAAELRQGNATRRSPFSLGWMVNWKNRGYYCDKAISGARERGLAPADYVPEYQLDTSKFTAGWETAALDCRPTEWWDVDVSGADMLIIRQVLTGLRDGWASYIAYNWWGHALACVGMRWDTSEKNNVVWIDWNSHDDGMIELAGNKGVPDEAYIVRATSLPRE